MHLALLVNSLIMCTPATFFNGQFERVRVGLRNPRKALCKFFRYSGVSIPSSYIPAYITSVGLAATDRMTITQRFVSLLGSSTSILLVDQFLLPAFTKIFRKNFGQQFPIFQVEQHLDPFDALCPLPSLTQNVTLSRTLSKRPSCTSSVPIQYSSIQSRFYPTLSTLVG